MSAIGRLRSHLWPWPRVGNDGLTNAERRQFAAEYQAGAAAKPTKAQMEELLAKMVARSRDQQPPPPA